MKTQLLITLDAWLFDFVKDTFQAAPELSNFPGVMCIKVHRTSMVGRYITLSLQANHKHIIQQFNGYFELYIQSSSNTLQLSGQTQFIKLNQEMNEMMNDFFENIFQNSFIYFVNGYRKDEPGAMRNAIREWIDRYELYEHDFSFCKLEQIYLRAQRRKPLTKFVLKRK